MKQFHDSSTSTNWVLDEDFLESTNSQRENAIFNFIDNELRFKIDFDYPKEPQDINKRKFEIESLSIHMNKFNELAKKIKVRMTFPNRMQRWKGQVIEIQEKTFKAKLDDLTNLGTYEIGIFDLRDVSDELELVRIGAVFYFSIGYDLNKGQIQKVSILRFQRIKPINLDIVNHVADNVADLDVQFE